MMTLGVPMLVVWVIGAPMLAFIILFRNRHSLEDNKVMKYMLLLYQGLKPDTYYWEFVNIARKFLVLLCITWFSSFNHYYQILSAVIVLVISIRLQIGLQPYKIKSNNSIEMFATTVNLITLFCGIIYVEERPPTYMSALVLAFVVGINSLFVIRCVYLLFMSYYAKSPTIQKIKENIASLFSNINESASVRSPRKATRGSNYFDEISGRNKVHNKSKFKKPKEESKWSQKADLSHLDQSIDPGSVDYPHEGLLPNIQLNDKNGIFSRSQLN